MPYEDVARLLMQSRARAEQARQQQRRELTTASPAIPSGIPQGPPEVYELGARAAQERLAGGQPASPGVNPQQVQDDLFKMSAPAAPEPTWTDVGVTGALRVVPAVAGSIGGFAAGAPTGLGAVPAAMAGGGAGSALGELLAQKYEVSRGLRPEVSPGEVAFEGGLGAVLSAVPGGRTVGRAGLMGGGQALGGLAARSAFQGEAPSSGDVLANGILGVLLGGGTKLAGNKLGRMLARPSPRAPGLPEAAPAPVAAPPPPPAPPSRLTPEQEMAARIVDRPPPPASRIDPEKVGPRYMGVRQGYVEGEPWGGWPGPPGTEDIVAEDVTNRLLLPERATPPRQGRPVTPSSGEVIPLASPRPPGMEETGIVRPRFNVLRDAFELMPEEPGGPVQFRARPVRPPVPPEGQTGMAFERPLAPGEPLPAIPPPVGAPEPVSPTRLKVTARFGPDQRVGEVEFGDPRLMELFLASNRISGRAAGSRKVPGRLAALKDWLESQFEVQFKAGGKSGLGQAASAYRKAVLQALKDAEPGKPVIAPDLEAILPDPTSNARAMFRQARREGFKGSPDDMREMAELEGFHAEGHDPDAGSASPRALLRAVANVGGISANRGSEYPEVAAWIRESTAWRPPKGSKVTRTGRPRKGTFTPTGSVDGMPIYNEVSGYKTFDSLQESLIESYPQFEHLRNSRDMADALQEAVGLVQADTKYRAPFGEGWWRQYVDEAGNYVSPIRGGRAPAPAPVEDVPFSVPGEDFAAKGLASLGGETGIRQPRINLLREQANVRPGTLPSAGPQPQPNAGVPAPGVDLAAGQASPGKAVPPAGPEPRPGRNWGTQAGAASPRLLGGIAGAGAGAAAGGTQGTTPEEKRRNALIGAVMGAGVGLAGMSAVSKVAGRAGAAPTVPEIPRGNPPQRTFAEGQRPPAGRVPSSVQGDERGLWSVAESARGPIPPAGKIPKERLRQNLSHLSPVIRDDLAQVIEDHNFFQRQRRGVRHHETTVETAKRITVELDKQLPRGTALNAEGGQALGMALASITGEKKALANKIAADVKRGIRNENDLFDFERLKIRQAILTASYVGAEAEAGRALEAYKILKTMQPFHVQAYKAARRKMGDVEGLEALALKLAESDDPMFHFAEARKAAGARMSKSEMMQSYFITNVLSGVPTQLRNTFGNAANLLVKNSVVPLLKAPIDVAWSRITGAPRSQFSGEVAQRWIGMQENLNGALADAYFVLQNGFSRGAVEDMISGVSAIDLGRKEFRGGGKNPFNWVGRGMEAADRFFLALNKGAAQRGYLYNQSIAALKAAKREITADSLAEEMVRQKVKYADNVAGQKEVMRQALEGVYREPLGPMAQRLGLMKRDIPALNYVIPFVNTVSNIFRQGYEHTPISLVVKGSKAFKRGTMAPFGASREAQTEMLAKGAFGTLAMLPIGYWAATGRISGNGPRDPAKRQQLMDTGWRPNSILLPIPEGVAKTLGASKSDTGQYWVNYALFQPVSIPMSLAANAFEAYQNVQESDEKAVMDMGATRQIGTFLQGVVKSGLSQSYLQGLFSLVGAVQSDESMADMWLQSMARSFVPMSGFVRGLARAQDDVVRRPRGVAQAIQADIPFMQQNVPARIGRYGEPIKRERPRLAAAFMVPEIEGEKADPIDMELNRLGIYLPRPSGRVEIRDQAGNLRKLSQADEEMGAVGRGVARRGVLTRVIQDPRYAQMPDVFKRLIIRRALNQATRYGSEAARYGILRQDRQLLERLIAPARRAAGQSLE